MFPRLLVFAAFLSAIATISLSDEPAPKEKGAPATIQLDQAKTLRLGKLLENVRVLSELKVSDDVFARLEDIKQQEQGAERAQFDELKKMMDATKNLPAAERAERMQAFMPKFQAARNATGETFADQRFGLLTAEQIERLDQLDLQDQGIGAFFLDEIAQALKLSDDQQQRIETIRTTYEAKFLQHMKSPFYQESMALRSTQPAILELLKERTAKVDEVLSKEQREKLAELQGKPFDQTRMGRVPGELVDLDRLRPRISPILQSLLSYDAVRKDLKLGPDAGAGVDAAIAKHREEMLRRSKAMQAQMAEAEKLSALQKAVQREEQMADRMLQSRKLEKEYADELNKYLTDAHVTRLKQINYQRGLRYALGFDGRDELGLTTDQMQKIMEIQMTASRQQIELHTPPLPQNPEATREFFAKQMERRKEQQKKEDAQMLDVLIPEQRQKLQELQGPPFDLSLLDAPRLIPTRPAPPTANPPVEDKPKSP